MGAGDTMEEDEIPVSRAALRFRLGPTLKRLTSHELYELCQLNRDWRIERTSEGELIAMPPTGGKTGRRNLELSRALGNWAEADGTGVAFDSSTGFILPNGAARSPDAAWVTRARWDALADDEKEEFPPLCPDFVVELRSRSDSLDALRMKMREYIANGTRLGWLVDPVHRRVYVYSAPDDERRLDNPTSVTGEPVLSGFVLDLRRMWD